ncbi:NAD(P)H-binding protein [Kocuria sp. CPCC 205295]
MLAEQGDTLTLFARDASRVDAPEGARVVEGDALDASALRSAVRDRTSSTPTSAVR